MALHGHTIAQAAEIRRRAKGAKIKRGTGPVTRGTGPVKRGNKRIKRADGTIA